MSNGRGDRFFKLCGCIGLVAVTLTMYLIYDAAAAAITALIFWLGILVGGGTSK